MSRSGICSMLYLALKSITQWQSCCVKLFEHTLLYSLYWALMRTVHQQQLTQLIETQPYLHMRVLTVGLMSVTVNSFKPQKAIVRSFDLSSSAYMHSLSQLLGTTTHDCVFRLCKARYKFVSQTRTNTVSLF